MQELSHSSPKEKNEKIKGFINSIYSSPSDISSKRLFLKSLSKKLKESGDVELSKKVWIAASSSLKPSLKNLPDDLLHEIFTYQQLPPDITQDISSDAKDVGQKSDVILIDRINKNKLPVKNWGMNEAQLELFLKTYGDKIEFLDFGLADALYEEPQIKNPLKYLKYCPNVISLSLKNNKYNLARIYNLGSSFVQELLSANLRDRIKITFTTSEEKSFLTRDKNLPIFL